MKEKLRKIKSKFHKYMIRPVVYQFSARFIIMLTVVLLWDNFLNKGTIRLPLGYGFTVPAALFAALGFMAYLRLDGIKAPKIDRKLFMRKKKPDRFYGDMIDYVDEPVINFEDLEDDEKDICLLISNIILVVVFLILSVVFG